MIALCPIIVKKKIAIFFIQDSWLSIHKFFFDKDLGLDAVVTYS